MASNSSSSIMPRSVVLSLQSLYCNIEKGIEGGSAVRVKPITSNIV